MTRLTRAENRHDIDTVIGIICAAVVIFCVLPQLARWVFG